MTKKNKLKIEVFVPLGSCVCNIKPFLEKIGKVTSKFKDLVDVQMKSTKSPEAFKYGIQNMGLVIDGKTKLPEDFDEAKLENVIQKEIAYASNNPTSKCSLTSEP